jgi:hypothetical protein
MMQADDSFSSILKFGTLVQASRQTSLFSVNLLGSYFSIYFVGVGHLDGVE